MRCELHAVVRLCDKLHASGALASACGGFALHIASAHVLVGAAVAPLASGQAISIGAVTDPAYGLALVVFFSCGRFEEVLRRVVLDPERGPVEIIEHQVHILALLHLQVVANFDVAVDLNFNVRVGLTRKGSRLGEPSVLDLLIFGFGPSRAIPHNALHLPRSRVAPASSPSEIVVACALAAHLLPAHLHFRPRLIQILEQVGLLPLVVAHVEGVTGSVDAVVPTEQLAPVDRHRIIVRTLLIWLTLRPVLVHHRLCSEGVRLHHLLTGTRLPGNVSSSWLLLTSILLELLAIHRSRLWLPDPVVVDAGQLVATVVEVVSCES
jgi:hypothetical protein